MDNVETLLQLTDKINLIWILICAAFVFFMQAGFCCLESGLSRSQNSMNVATKNIVDFCVIGIFFWLFGYGIMFGESWNGLIGTTNFAMGTDSHEPFEVGFFIFQLVVCGTAATIASGAVADRMRFVSYTVFAGFLGIIIYPIFGHWCWGGVFNHTSTGWLESLGFIDFGGSIVIHATAAWAAFAAVWMIGARKGRFDNSNDSTHVRVYNVPLAATGLFILWLGWIGLNGGKELSVDGQLPWIVINTMLAGAAGGITVLNWNHFQSKQYQLHSIINGILAGLVAVSASCPYIAPYFAILVGAVAALVMLAGTKLIEKLKLDDVCGIIPTHGFAAVWGTLAIAWIVPVEHLTPGFSRLAQFQAQVLGVIVCFAWVFPTSVIFLACLNKISPLRIGETGEDAGLDAAEHGGNNELGELLAVMEKHVSGEQATLAETGAGTDMGLVAAQYNRVIQSRDQAITQLKHHTDALETSQTQLNEQKEKLTLANKEALSSSKAKSEFLANMSHEIRTPMTSILGYIDILEEESYGRPNSLESISVVKKHGHHLLGLINDILDISKIEAGKLDIESIDCPTLNLVSEVETLMAGRTKENDKLNFRCEFQNSVPEMIQTDPTRLKQILINLIGNAIKFTKEGEVKLAVQFLNDEDKPEIQFDVTDTGIGMTPEQLGKLFQKFSQADTSTTRKFGGTGLGLTISRSLAEALGGTLTVTSTYGEGSTFSLKIPTGKIENIPLVTPQSTEETTSEKENENETEQLPESLENCRVLIVEDGIDNQRLIKFLLKKDGATVELANNGLEGIEKIEENIKNDSPFNVILMDMQMPILDGYSATKQLRENNYDGPIIALTAHAMSSDRRKCLDAGCTDFTTKPINKTELIRLVHHYSTRKHTQPEPTHV